MIINELKYFYFELNFSTPFRNSKGTFNTREGFIVRLKDNLNNIAYGECSPLPGFSYETLDDVENQLKKLSVLFKDFNVGDDLHMIENFSNNRNLFPSVKFGIEQCLFNLWVNGKSDYFEKTFGLSKKEIDVNAVFGAGGRLDIISGVEKKISNGYNTFKFKIGNDSFDDDYKLVESLRKYFGNSINIRLDANGNWDIKQAVENIEKFSSFNIQYIEEPCARFDQLMKLSETSPIPIAADESLNIPTDVLNAIRNSNIKFLVLKPMIVTGIFSAVKLIEEAERTGKVIIISSSFESAVGKNMLVMLSAITNHYYAHGLDIADQFNTDICEDKFLPSNGKIFFDHLYFPPKFDLEYL